MAAGLRFLPLLADRHGLHRPDDGRHRGDAVLAGGGISPFETAPELLHNAGMELLHPLPVLALVVAAGLLLGMGQRLRQAGETWEMAGAVLVTTVWVDGLFLVAALIQPGMSGLIE